MKARTGKPLMLTAGALLLAAVCVAGVVVARRGRQEHLPKEYLSEVKGLAVEGMRVEREGRSSPALIVVIRNKTGRAVTAYTVTVGDFHVGEDGGLASDEPRPVIEPHGTREVAIPVNNLVDDQPLVITEAFYADGGEEGREQIRGWTRTDRAREKAKREAGKGAPK